MNELQIFTDKEQPFVSARELHDALEATERFSVWIQRYLPGFIEGEDFTNVSKLTVVNNGANRELQDYQCSIDMAKHICLMSRTEKGKECRQYLIDLEKAWNTPEQVLARALKVADRVLADKERLIAEMKPKAEFFDTVADSKTALPMDQVAKVLDMGIGRNKLFEFLREHNVLQSNNVPYQRFVDAGWFRTIEQHYQKGYEPCISVKTLVYQKGVDGIRKMLLKA